MYKLLCRLRFVESNDVSYFGFPLLILSLFKRGYRGAVSNIRAYGVGAFCILSLMFILAVAAMYCFIMGAYLATH